MKQTNNNFAKEIWLNYFNNVLFEKGIITEKERNAMSNLIFAQCSNVKKPTN